MNITRDGFRNIYRVNESMSEPEWYDFATNATDAGDRIYWLNYDHGIAEDSDDCFYSAPASLYA